MRDEQFDRFLAEHPDLDELYTHRRVARRWIRRTVAALTIGFAFIVVAPLAPWWVTVVWATVASIIFAAVAPWTVRVLRPHSSWLRGEDWSE